MGKERVAVRAERLPSGIASPQPARAALKRLHRAADSALRQSTDQIGARPIKSNASRTSGTAPPAAT